MRLCVSRRSGKVTSTLTVNWFKACGFTPDEQLLQRGLLSAHIWIPTAWPRPPTATISAWVGRERPYLDFNNNPYTVGFLAPTSGFRQLGRDPQRLLYQLG
jgi:hypothetical protein